MSIVDELMCRKGEIDPDFIGINQAKAGRMIWDRERGESEEQFLLRCRKDAALAGYKLLCVAGHLTVGSAHQFTVGDCGRLGVDWVT